MMDILTKVNLTLIVLIFLCALLGSNKGAGKYNIADVIGIGIAMILIVSLPANLIWWIWS
jgi:hypothetical protein